MELALTMLAGLGSTAAGAASASVWAAGTTVAAAGAAPVALGGFGASALSVLQGLATVGSIASTAIGGVGALASGLAASEQAKLEGDMAYVESEQAANRIRRELIKKTGDARVAFAASGLDISSGAAVERDLRSQAAFETEIERLNGLSRQAQARSRSRQMRTGAYMDLAGAGVRAGGQYLDYRIDIAQRGV